MFTAVLFLMLEKWEQSEEDLAKLIQLYNRTLHKHENHATFSHPLLTVQLNIIFLKDSFGKMYQNVKYAYL